MKDWQALNPTPQPRPLPPWSDPDNKLCPDHIEPAHWQEWLRSAVHPDIIAANLRSLSGSTAYDYIGSEHMGRLNTGRLATYWLRRYQHIEAGGWWCNGIGEWGCLKPDRPFTDKDGHSLKYEHPFRTPTRLFLLQNPLDPITWQERKADTSIPLTLAEGAKKTACLESHGYPAIGLPGITGAVRKDEASGIRRYRLMPDLEAFEWHERKVFILFDHDRKPKTRTAVRREINKLAQELSKKGAIPYIVTLPGPEKGVDDFVMAHGVEALHQLYAEALPYAKWQVAQYNQLSHPVATTYNQRYLPADLPIPSGARIVGIKSPKGTGKTHAMRQIVGRYQDEAQRSLMMCHRVQLGVALGNRVGLPFVSDLDRTEEGSLFGYVLCVDSMVADSQARFSPEGWDVLIIDEVEQVISHLLNADTEVSKRRIAVLNNLAETIRHILSKENGLIICLDADLSDLTFEFLNGLAGTDIQPHIIENVWKPEADAWTVYNYTQSTPRKLYETAIQKAEAGKKLFVTTQSQQPKSKWGTCTLEVAFGQRCPKAKILRIDSESIADPSHAAYRCIENLDEVLKQFDIVIVSPSIETGVSIDLRGFDAVFAFCQGISSANGTRQALARVREPIERHVWLAKRGLEFVGNGATSIKSLLAAQHKAAQWHIRQLQTECFDLEGETLTVNDTALRVWAKMGVRHNAGMVAYRESVLEGLAGEGHHIVPFNQEIEDGELQEELTTIRDEHYLAEREAIAQTELISDAKALELESKKAKSKTEWRQHRKHFLKKRYGVEVTEELVQKDDARWYPKLRLHYLFTVGNQFLKQREVQTFSSAVTQMQVWYPTLNRNQMGLKIALLEFLGLRSLLQPDAEWHKDSPEVAQLEAKARANAWNLRAFLGVSVSDKDTPIAIVQRLLGSVGLKLTYDRREGGRGDRKRIYTYQEPADGRYEVFGHWLERDALTRSQAAVSIPGNQVFSA